MKPRSLLLTLLAAAPLFAQQVHTTEGSISGSARNGIASFLGIPYAAPPVGPLRWQPPAPHAPWTAVRPATNFGNTCPQNTTLGVFAGPPSNTEDCLYLNVYAPSNAKNLPVLVWFHGGGLFDGSGNDYDPTALVGNASHPIILVTINYRLGLLGYFAHPAIDHEGHTFGNYGVLDQQAALQWVQRNIAAFGGDPARVTIGGQSAGATSATALMIAPSARGLFRSAILQSGVMLSIAPLNLAEKRGSSFSNAAGCDKPSPQKTAACLRSLSVDKILSLQGNESSIGPYITGYMIDGTTLAISGTQAWTTGHFTQVPVINGMAHDEAAFNTSIHEYFNAPLTAAEYTRKIQTNYTGPSGANHSPPNYPADTPTRVAAEYPLSRFPNPSAADIALFSDSTACQALRESSLLSKWVPVYAYEFNDPTAPWYFPPASFDHLSAHTIDIQFLFPNWHGGPKGIAHPLSPAEQKLSAELVAQWTNFIYTGDPGKNWQTFNSTHTLLQQTLPSSNTITAANYAKDHRCQLWDTILTY